MNERDVGPREAAEGAADTGNAETAEDAGAELGGDPACWLDRVCFACGRFIDDRRAAVCPHCGSPREEPADGQDI